MSGHLHAVPRASARVHRERRVPVRRRERDRVLTDHGAGEPGRPRPLRVRAGDGVVRRHEAQPRPGVLEQQVEERVRRRRVEGSHPLTPGTTVSTTAIETPRAGACRIGHRPIWRRAGVVIEPLMGALGAHGSRGHGTRERTARRFPDRGAGAPRARRRAHGELDSASMPRKGRQPRARAGVGPSEQGRRSAERRREAAEGARAAAEVRRVRAESGRTAAEEVRQLAEEARALTEKARGSAEEARRAADEARRHLDTIRTLAEGIRRGAEVKRESAEAVRRDSARRSESMTRRAIREEMQVFSELERTRVEWPSPGGAPQGPEVRPASRRRPR